MNKCFEILLYNLAAAIIVRSLGWSILQQKGTIVVVGILGVVSQSSYTMEAQKVAKLDITIFLYDIQMIECLCINQVLPDSWGWNDDQTLQLKSQLQ